MSKRIMIVVVVGLLILAGVTYSSRPRNKQELVIYSARKEQFVQPLIDKFEQETGIKVKLLTGDEALVNKLIEESNRPQADIFFSNDAGALEYLRLRASLAPNSSASVTAVDPMYRAEDGSWVGLSARTRVLMYNRDLISEAEMPQNLWDLVDSKWQGQFMITRGGNGSAVAHIAALSAVWGEEKTLEWMQGIKSNAGAIVDGHTDVRKAVGRGEFKFGLVNNYYYHLQLAEDKDNNVGVIYPDQGPNGIGAFVNAAGVGLIKNAPNSTNAGTFIDFLLKPEQLKVFAYNSKEVPLDPSIESVPEARSIRDYKVMNVSLQEIGGVWESVKSLIEKSGLDIGK